MFQAAKTPCFRDEKPDIAFVTPNKNGLIRREISRGPQLLDFREDECSSTRCCTEQVSRSMAAMTAQAHDVVILAGARTPQGRLNGQLASFTAVELGAKAIAAAVERAGVAPADVDQVIMGQVLQAGAGQNPARQSAVGAGIGWNVPAVTINKVCLSGLTAVIDAARLIRSGEASVVVAGGQESMTRAPHILPGSRQGWSYGAIQALDVAAHDGLTDAFDNDSMGLSTERGNIRLNISRTAQDEVAAASHQRAATAMAAGVFDGEIVPVTVPQRKGEPLVLTRDEGIRAQTTTETLAGLRPAFTADGAITAGNSSPLSDGASAVVDRKSVV